MIQNIENRMVKFNHDYLNLIYNSLNSKKIQQGMN